MTRTDLAYRTTAAAGASGLSLLIALYDTLVGDLRRAAAAQRAGNREERSKELKHALTVIGCLQNWVDAESGDLAKRLIAFYSGLRRKMIEAQAKESAEMLEEMMAEVLKLRQTWQQIDQGTAAPRSENGQDYGPEILPPARTASLYGSFSAPTERRQLSWSA
ncbi:MAG TPA: flagellar export chaperone FliS [Terracidiphilus sp.]|nr:flagellar export chaperone FliS [Terracidiphilus sp.]